MKRILILLIVLILCLPPISAFANGGALYLKTMNIGSDYHDTVTTTTLSTDSNTSGGGLIGKPNTSTDTMWYEFPTPVSVSGYTLRTSNWGVDFKFVDSSGNLLQYIKDPAWAGTPQTLSSPIRNVKGFYLYNATQTQASIEIKDVDLFLLDTTPPSEVTSLTVKPLSKTSIGLTWVDPPDGDLSSINIYRDGVFLTSVNKGVKSYTDTSLTPSTTYQYKIETIDVFSNKSTGVQVSSRTLDPDVTPPAEVTNLKTFVYNDRIKMSWTNPPDTDFLKVDIFKSGILVAVVNTPATQFTDYDLEEHTTYTYRFRTVDNDGNSSVGVSITETTKGKPAKITSLTGAVGNKSTTIFFDASKDPDLDGYYLYRDGQNIATLTTNTYVDTNVTNGQTYSYQVSAFNEWGESLLSDKIDLQPTPPPPPSNVSLSGSNTPQGVQFNFSSNGATKYYFYRDGVVLATLSGGETTYLDNTVHPSTNYKYWIVAENEGGLTASDIIDIKTPELQGIKNLRITDRKTNQVKVTWDASPNAKKYKVDLVIYHQLVASASTNDLVTPPPATEKTVETTTNEYTVTGLLSGEKVSATVSVYNDLTSDWYGHSTVETIVPEFDVETPTANDVIGTTFSFASNFWFLFLIGAAIILVPSYFAVARNALGKKQTQEVTRRTGRETSRDIRIQLRGNKP